MASGGATHRCRQGEGEEVEVGAVPARNVSVRGGEMAKKAAKPCTCVEQVDKKLREDGIKLVRLLMVNFTTGKGGLGPPILAVERTGDSKKKRKLPAIICAYCPVCGTKYPE